MTRIRPTLSSVFLRTQSDERLVALARQGYEAAFEAIVERYRRPIQGYCRRLLLPEARAEDTVQEIFLAAWSSLQQGTEVRQLRPWLYRVAHNTAVNALRRSGYDYDELRESLQADGSPEEDLERRAVIRETLAGLAALPERQREVLLRTAVEGVSQADVAREFGVSEGAVSQLVYRARSALRGTAMSLVPFSVVRWVADVGSGDVPMAVRVAGAATGSAGGALGLGKAIAVVATVGTIAAAPAGIHRLTGPSGPEASALSSPFGGRSAAAQDAAVSQVGDRKGTTTSQLYQAGASVGDRYRSRQSGTGDGHQSQSGEQGQTSGQIGADGQALSSSGGAGTIGPQGVSGDSGQGDAGGIAPTGQSGEIGSAGNGGGAGQIGGP